MTSNHPKVIDPAIIRPGRVDHEIMFELCDEYQFANIFKYFVGQDYKFVNENFIFPEKKYSTSFLINTIILPNRSSPKFILEQLIN